MVKFDEFLSSRLDQYCTDPRLLSYVVFLDLQEAWRDYQRARQYRLSDYDRYIRQGLLCLDKSMLDMDRHCLVLQMLDSEGFVHKPVDIDDRTVSRDARTCCSYRSLLLEYLTDRTTSGKHFLDVQRYAAAALWCMEYLYGNRLSMYVFYDSLSLSSTHWIDSRLRNLEYTLPALHWV